MTARSCSVDGCDNPCLARGWCNLHYKRQMARGTTNPRSASERFWEKVNKTDTCWLWTASTNNGGYGAIGGGRTARSLAHRYAYEELVGPIPEGLQIDHLCRVRNCVNPSHLEPVTQRENLLRGEGVTAIAARQTHCPRGHPYSGENLYLRPTGARVCRSCHRDRQRVRYHIQFAAIVEDILNGTTT